MAALTEFVDELIIGRYRNAMRQAGEGAQIAGAQHCCLIALGGYGHRELSPYSDIDIMFLYSEKAGEAAPALFREVLHHLWDLGFQVGHSMRSIPDCIELAGKDLTIRTTMMASRFLAGSPYLFQEFHRRYFREVVGRGAGRFIEQKMEERRREYVKFGQTVYLLEPNVKKSKGGLRDFQLIRWAGMAQFQSTTLQDLTDRGLLSRQEFLSITDARDFLWRVRAFLHFEAGKAQEILSFDEQIRLASLYRVPRSPPPPGGGAVHAAVLPAYDGASRELAPVCGSLLGRAREASIIPLPTDRHGGRLLCCDRSASDRSLRVTGSSP